MIRRRGHLPCAVRIADIVTYIAIAARTMNKDIGLTATQCGYGAGIPCAGIPCAGNCAFEIASNLGLYRCGARRRRLPRPA